MKKIVFLTSVLFFLLIGVVSCSSDENENEIEIPLQPQSNEIKVKLNQISSNSEALFYIKGSYTIDWGDGQQSTNKDADEQNLSIKHQYKKNKEYIITITVKEELDFFKNFSALRLSDFEEEEIPFYEEIIIGSNVNINYLYLQTSGVKKIRQKNPTSVKSAVILGGDIKWNLSMVDTKYLTLYIPNNDNINLENLPYQHLSIHVDNKISSLSVSTCENLESLDISANFNKIATINNLSIKDLPKVNDLRLHYLKGKDVILTNMPKLEYTNLGALYYETLDMTNTTNSLVDMKLKMQATTISNSLKMSKQLTEVEIDNTMIETLPDIKEIDFSVCPQLKSVDIKGLGSLYSLKFGSANVNLDKVDLKIIPAMNSLDFSECENLTHVWISYAQSLSNVKFSDKNKVLRNVRFQYVHFTEASIIEMIQTLPNFPIPNIPTVNRRLLSVRYNDPSLKDNAEVIATMKTVSPSWSGSIN